MVCDVTELCEGFARLFESQVGLRSDIGRPELGGRDVVVRLDRLQQLKHARRLAASGSIYCGGDWHLQLRRQRGRWESAGKLARQTDCGIFCAAQGKYAAGALHGEVVVRK